jgi:hypothetical protein
LVLLRAQPLYAMVVVWLVVVVRLLPCTCPWGRARTLRNARLWRRHNRHRRKRLNTHRGCTVIPAAASPLVLRVQRASCKLLLFVVLPSLCLAHLAQLFLIEPPLLQLMLLSELLLLVLLSLVLFMLANLVLLRRHSRSGALLLLLRLVAVRRRLLVHGQATRATRERRVGCGGGRADDWRPRWRSHCWKLRPVIVVFPRPSRAAGAVAGCGIRRCGRGGSGARGRADAIPA